MKWANGYFDKKVVSSSEQKAAPLDLLVTGSLPISDLVSDAINTAKYLDIAKVSCIEP